MLFLPITWLNLRRSAVKVSKRIGKSGSGISKKLTNRNSVTDSRRIIGIGMCVGHEKHCTQNTLKVKRSNVKVTRYVVAPKHRIYPVNVTR